MVPVGEVEGTKIEQVMVGSCTNGSWEDMWAVTQVLQGRHVHPDVSFVLFPGSHRILETMAREGLLADLLASGALISEPTCGACAGIGHVPAAGTKSLRAFNRNFPGRSGVKGDEVYLCSSVTAAASALTGAITDPRTAGAPASLYLPESFAASSAGLVTPDGTGDVVRGPNIKSVPLGEPVAEALDAPVLLKLGDKVSTDDISPAGAAVLVFRSNIPAIAEFCFKYVDPEFAARARAAGSGIVVAGELYGQGSSREAAAIGPMYLGVRAVLAKSFADSPGELDQLGRRAAHVRRSVRVRRARARRPAAPRRPAGRARLRRSRQRPRHAPGPALLGLVRADDARARHPPRGWAPRPDVPHARTRGGRPTVRAGPGHAGGMRSDVEYGAGPHLVSGHLRSAAASRSPLQ